MMHLFNCNLKGFNRNFVIVSILLLFKINNTISFALLNTPSNFPMPYFIPIDSNISLISFFVRNIKKSYYERPICENFSGNSNATAGTSSP